MVTGERSIDEIFDRRNRVQRMLDVEAALALALARAAVIPDATAAAIVAQCDVRRIDLDSLARAAEDAGNEAIPAVEQLRELVRATDSDAATYVHWGATSQDVIDTALVLQLRDALRMIDGELARVIAALADLADAHAATPMVGRTLLQAAAPTTFGFKAGGWLDALLRHRTRFGVARDELLVLQFGGAAGNLATLGGDGPRVGAALAEGLELKNPIMSWHAARDRVANLATMLALIVGTLGKMARDMALLAQSEIAEVREPATAGRGRSSTMPQKKNPIGCASILAAALRVPALAATMLSAMAQEHERGLGGWHAEWETLPSLVIISHRALVHASFLAGKLEVDAARMARNIEATNGLVFAESASVALMARVGRDKGGDIIRRAIERVVTEGIHLRDALDADPEVAAIASRDEVVWWFDVGRCLGVAEATARRVAALARSNLNAGGAE